MRDLDDATAAAHSARDPEAALQYARDVAWRALNRRDRTVEEMRTMLAGKRIEPATIDQVVAELTDFGHLDDARYAQRFTEDRRRLDAWGSERIARRLRLLGVAAEHIERASAEAGEEDEMERAVALLRHRFPHPPADDRERSRALGLLVRRGYESEAAYDAIRRYEQG
ncbi:MAG: hypothetical protein AVDCRST_MAG65-438 [uncultured Solirubrobacteraceae bacterium]|uniref:Regulatory protein RecX n=1 Tax=uncultured Solirubrobacteraceae bacterium TaxID=1162706 RepID=A0A6J4R909_9ACTN|nr:MAG: hypothetical protein AVDCRST_MAG65-438 [uncultured Solirubrobacteraceae bacterium]